MRIFLKRWRFPLMMAAGIALAPAIVLVREVFAARDCVAQGGMYDYVGALCFMSAEEALDPASTGPLVWISLLVGLKITGVAVVTLLPWRISAPRLGRLLWKRIAA